VSNKEDGWFEKTDRFIVKCLKALSNISGIFLIGIMLVAFFNVLGEKLFHHGIPMSTELIQYFHVPVVFLAAAYVTLDPGHTTIDLLFRKFPEKVKVILAMIANILGCIICIFVGYVGIARVQDAFTHHTRSSTTGAGFYIWPFAVIFVVGFFLLALSFVWNTVRVIKIGPKEIKGPNDKKDEAQAPGNEGGAE